MKISPVSVLHPLYCIRQKEINPDYQSKTDIFESENPYTNAVAFQGINATGVVKQRGILMHITSLPAHRSFCGQFGDPQTLKFINWIKSAKQTHWIMNPLNQLEDNLCPYSSAGRFSRNKFIVNLNELTTDKYGRLLKESELPDDITAPEFTLDMLERQKNPRFKLAFERFKKLSSQSSIKKEYNNFLETNDKLWLDEYANYDSVSRLYGTTDWLKWDKQLQTAPEDSRKEGVSLKNKIFSVLEQLDKPISKKEYDNNVELYKFEQFLYDKQFNEMVELLNKNDIHLIMDLPIGVSASGVDTWGKKNIFLLDNEFKPTKVSGCPPEKAFGYTQVWGTALYDYDSPDFWQYQEDSLRQLLKTADLRLDHFVGYINRATIPVSYTKPDGTVLSINEIFNPVKEGGMGKKFFLPEWIENINDKKSPKGENVFELFIRIAQELGKNPEDTYILENFGPLAKTKAYKKFDKKYGKDFISQRIPIGMGIANTEKKSENINSPFNIGKVFNIAILTGNHDLPSLKETVDNLLDENKKGLTSIQKKSQKLFKRFCSEVLNLTPEEMKDKNVIFENLMKWHYTRDVKQVQTTLQDALGIYWRPNIPGSWNGMLDKFLMKPTPEALLPFWNRVFAKDFLNRDNKSGINSGYKEAADNFVKMMEDLYPEK